MAEILKAEINLGCLRTVSVEMHHDGTVIRKQLLWEDFKKIIEVANDGSGLAFTIPRLPDGTVQTVYTDSENYKCCIHVEHAVRPVMYFGERYMIPYPNLLFLFEVKSARLCKSKVFAVTDSRKCVTPATKLYNFPFGNVHANSGDICWGGNSDAFAVPCITELERATVLFFSAEMNNDLFGEDSVQEKLSLSELIKKLNGKECFDTSILVDTHQTLANLL